MTEDEATGTDFPGIDTPNKEAIAEWVAALRSGEYRQGQGWLGRPWVAGGFTTTSSDASNMKYCCLGVACEIFTNRADLHRHFDPDQRSLFFDGQSQHLPENMLYFLGFRDTPEVIVRLPGSDVEHTVDLIAANDDHNWTFEQIADALEATYLKEETDDPRKAGI